MQLQPLDLEHLHREVAGLRREVAAMRSELADRRWRADLRLLVVLAVASTIVVDAAIVVIARQLG